MPVIRARLRPALWGKVQIKVREVECGDCVGKKNCKHKYTFECQQCDTRVFKDEEFERDGTGTRHWRCRDSAVDRPIYMHVFPCQ